ncbi:MAG: hypothetical protein KatS3mg060_0224 [Dehalococcoidia bacterium]|nr:MAG: hypothetical protein KatS3mg060_0224 [Dehalococcoidia bacterium]
MDVGHHVAAVHADVGVPGSAQGDVEDRAVLGDVDRVAAEHRVDALPQTARVREGDKEPDRLVGQPVLRVVEVDADTLGDQPLATLRICSEQIAQVDILHPLVMRLERLPFRPPRQVRRRDRGH